MVLEMEAIDRKLPTVEELSRLVPLEENVVEGKLDQMTDIINKDFKFKFREAAEILDEDSINLTEALAGTHLKSSNYKCANVIKLSMFLQHFEFKEMPNI